MQSRHGNSWESHQKCYVSFNLSFSASIPFPRVVFWSKLLRFMMKSDTHGTRWEWVSSRHCFKFRREKNIQLRGSEKNVLFIYTDCIYEKYPGSEKPESWQVTTKFAFKWFFKYLCCAVFLTGKMEELFAICSFGIFRNTWFLVWFITKRA